MILNLLAHPTRLEALRLANNATALTPIPRPARHPVSFQANPKFHIQVTNPNLHPLKRHLKVVERRSEYRPGSQAVEVESKMRVPSCEGEERRYFLDERADNLRGRGAEGGVSGGEGGCGGEVAQREAEDVGKGFEDLANLSGVPRLALIRVVLRRGGV